MELTTTDCPDFSNPTDIVERTCVWSSSHNTCVPELWLAIAQNIVFPLEIFVENPFFIQSKCNCSWLIIIRVVYRRHFVFFNNLKIYCIIGNFMTKIFDFHDVMTGGHLWSNIVHTVFRILKKTKCYAVCIMFEYVHKYFRVFIFENSITRNFFFFFLYMTSQNRKKLTYLILMHIQYQKLYFKHANIRFKGKR